MPHTITARQFVAKWSQMRLKEISAYQSHFIDVCLQAPYRPRHLRGS